MTFGRVTRPLAEEQKGTRGRSLESVNNICTCNGVFHVWLMASSRREI